MNYVIFCYREDYKCLELCIEQIRRVDQDAKFHLFDDGAAPLDPEQVPAGDDVCYKVTYFARRGNLNGRNVSAECWAACWTCPELIPL